MDTFLAQQRPHREGVEAALQLLATVENDVVPGDTPGLVVAHQRAAAVRGNVQAVDVSRDAEPGAGNLDDGPGIPRDRPVGLRFRPAERDLAIGSWHPRDLRRGS